MNKRKTNITVTDFEDKKYGAGKRYTRFNTDQGWISCFDKKTIETLKDSEGKIIGVEIVTADDGREKITKTGNVEAPITEEKLDETPAIPARKSVKGSAYEKDPIGLAVEVFNSLIGLAIHQDQEMINVVPTMNDAITLVKQAQLAFKE